MARIAYSCFTITTVLDSFIPKWKKLCTPCLLSQRTLHVIVSRKWIIVKLQKASDQAQLFLRSPAGCLIDSMNEISRSRHESTREIEDQVDNLGLSLIEVHLTHIFPLVYLILRRHGFLWKKTVFLPMFTSVNQQPVLDRNSFSKREILKKKYLVKGKQNHYKEADLAKKFIEGPADFLGSAKCT